MKRPILALTLAALAIAGSAAAQPAPATPEPTAAAAAPAPLSPPVVAKADSVETLIMDGRFKILVKGLEDTNLLSLVKTTPSITLFAPTDAAFASLPAGKLDALKADKAAMQQFLVLHMINAPVDSAKIKGAKIPFPTVGGQKILADGSEPNVLKAGDATIIQADVKPTTGLIQVLDGVMQPYVAPAA